MSTYSVEFNVDQNTINNLMQSYLNAENFKIYEKMANNTLDLEIKC